MIWATFIYYTIFNILVVYSTLFLLRSNISKIINLDQSVNFIQKNILLFSTFFLLISFLFLNFSFDYITNCFVSESFSILNMTLSKLFNWNFLIKPIFFVYLYPYIYVFILVTVLSVIFCLTYNTDELFSFTSYVLFILFAGYTLFFTDSIILFFLSYELLLVPSFFILYKFAKTRRCVEAAYLMFFWTQFGAMFLILALLYIMVVCQSNLFSVLSLTYFSPFEVNFLFSCLIIGFGVKLPIWPFYGWLPKAHVEASTNFSIFLSGVLVKFAFFGLTKCLLSIQLECTFVFIIPFLLIGIFDSVFKLFYQTDLKKLVAYSTVVEMHWLTICIISGQSNLLLAGFCMLISHALISTNSFLIVDAISRRFNTRLVTEISGLNFSCNKLFIISLLNILVFLGFPGSIFFISEFLFFSFFFDFFPVMCLTLIVLLYLLGPTFFFRSWMNVMFGYSNSLKSTLPADLSSRELFLFLSILILMYWLGISWQSFIL